VSGIAVVDEGMVKTARPRTTKRLIDAMVAIRTRRVGT
jgi:uncharacterized protein YjeT (DUF2065 family)